MSVWHTKFRPYQVFGDREQQIGVRVTVVKHDQNTEVYIRRSKKKCISFVSCRPCFLIRRGNGCLQAARRNKKAVSTINCFLMPPSGMVYWIKLFSHEEHNVRPSMVSDFDGSDAEVPTWTVCSLEEKIWQPFFNDLYLISVLYWRLARWYRLCNYSLSRLMCNHISMSLNDRTFWNDLVVHHVPLPEQSRWSLWPISWIHPAIVTLWNDIGALM